MQLGKLAMMCGVFVFGVNGDAMAMKAEGAHSGVSASVAHVQKPEDLNKSLQDLVWDYPLDSREIWGEDEKKDAEEILRKIYFF